MSLTNDQLLTRYLQVIEDIEWLLVLRAAPGHAKTALISQVGSTYAQKICNHFWLFTEDELKSIKVTNQIKINKIISEVDINQIL
ncbi:hypothetical protein [Pedobacter sp. Leaf250]|uniref:hypothetical protein n=1 Tax=Pedobacter sp. Leaf250 TaxID=2876559 RepID=UPI001E44FEF0|nr:hypothetical protein [Pedobacter sp. Leaf250]